MKKKRYITPLVTLSFMEAATLLAGSNGAEFTIDGKGKGPSGTIERTDGSDGDESDAKGYQRWEIWDSWDSF